MTGKMKSIVLSVSLLVGPTAAFAAGDPPRKMTITQVATYYKSIQSLLSGDEIVCPTDQRPVSGVISGGASPSGGRQQTVLTFSKGATVTVDRT